ncbi:hypothetical protein [Paraburkholderia sp. BL21I4N1]|nr:hypothetical protein [Paraburkholderia sp. BL21I4N1]PQV54290.1 hypothetical protein B0G83_101472 [Paraburkholderia sp. BL21I4N1]
MKRTMKRPATWANRAGNTLLMAFVVTVVVLSHPLIIGQDRLRG